VSLLLPDVTAMHIVDLPEACWKVAIAAWAPHRGPIDSGLMMVRRPRHFATGLLALSPAFSAVRLIAVFRSIPFATPPFVPSRSSTTHAIERRVVQPTALTADSPNHSRRCRVTCAQDRGRQVGTDNKFCAAECEWDGEVTSRTFASGG